MQLPWPSKFDPTARYLRHCLRCVPVWGGKELKERTKYGKRLEKLINGFIGPPSLAGPEECLFFCTANVAKLEKACTSY